MHPGRLCTGTCLGDLHFGRLQHEFVGALGQRRDLEFPDPPAGVLDLAGERRLATPSTSPAAAPMPYSIACPHLIRTGVIRRAELESGGQGGQAATPHMWPPYRENRASQERFFPSFQ